MRNLKPLLLKLGSLEMTLVSLGLMMFVVFFGTLAQVHIGTFAAQQSYFNSVIVWGEPFGFRMPILPGGLVVGAVWFANLLASFIIRFRLEWKNLGIIISHSGLMVLLLGQFLTQSFAKESIMAIELGQTLNYSESSRETELVFVDGADPVLDQVVSIPYSIFSRKKEISTPHLPFEIRIRSFFPHSNLAMLKEGQTGAMATQGIGTRVNVMPLAPLTTDDRPNTVTAAVEIMDGLTSLGTWLVSTDLGAPQTIAVGGKEFKIALQHKRTYYPFHLTLKEFHHDIYPGTDIPKNFSSLVHLVNEEKKEDRDVLIYMNNPLRHDGKTFYQSSFGKNDTLSIFQVMENSFWLAPYISCILVILGLAIQFLSHLLVFLRKPS